MSEKTDGENMRAKDESAQKKVHRLEKSIEDSVSDLERTTTEISDQLRKKEEAVRNEFNETNVALGKLGQDLHQNVAQARKDVNASLRWIHGRLGNVELVCWIAAFVFPLIYIGILMMLNSPLTLDALSVMCVGVTLAVLVAFSSRLAKSGVDTETITIGQYFGDLLSWATSKTGRRLKSHESFEAVDQGLHSATTAVRKLIAATREFNPALKAVFDQATFQFRMSNFRHTLLNALRFYGLDVDAESQKSILSFQTGYNTEDEWLADLSKSLAKKLGVSFRILSLFYNAYVGNAEGTRNTWLKIRENPQELSELAKILIKALHSDYLDYSNPELIKLSIRFLQNYEEFEPSKFNESLHNFHVDLEMLKDSVRQALTHFGFKPNSSQEQAISEFTPGDIDVGNWKDDLLENASARMRLSKEIVALLVEEYLGNVAEAQRAFAKIKQSEPKTTELLNILNANGILKTPDRYAASTQSVLRVLRHLVSERDFLSIEHLRDESNRFFSQLNNSKQRTLEALTAYNIKIPEAIRKHFEDEYLPDEVSIPDMIDFFARVSGIKKEFLFLFYYEFTQDAAALQRAFADVVQHNLAKGLAKLLIDLGFIETSGDSERELEAENLESVLLSFETFRMSSTQSRYESFRNLLVWSRNLAAFCGEHELVAKEFKVGLPWLLKLLKKSTTLKSYEQLQIVCEENLTKSDLQHTTPDILHAGVIATLVMFFKSQEDSRLYEACRDAAKSDLVSKILYHFISRHGEAQQLKQERVTLRTAIQEVLTGTTITYPYIDDVRDKLALGRVPESISGVATVRFEGHLKEVAHMVREKEEVLKGLQLSLHQFFEAELKEDVILQLLRMQVISAYIITTPSDKPVISLIDNEMVPKFRDVLVIEKGTGRYTRIGIVPVGMSFEQFHGRFTQIFQQAVGEHCTNDQSQRRADFSANIIRIFPVEATFKVVAGDPTAGTVVEDPVTTIRDLFLNRVSTETNLALAATARVNDPERLALRKVVVSLFDGYTNLLLLRKSSIDPLIGTRKPLQAAFESGAFDRELLARMQCGTLTELARKVHTIASTSKGRQEIKQAIAGHVASILKMFQTRMDSQERENLANEIFEGLHSIGLVLTTQ